jgi:hypothetical protein
LCPTRSTSYLGTPLRLTGPGNAPEVSGLFQFLDQMTRRPRTFVLVGAAALAVLGLSYGLLASPYEHCVYLGGIDDTCFWPRVSVLWLHATRPVAALLWMAIGAVLGGLIGLALAPLTRRLRRVGAARLYAVGLGLVLGTVLFVMTRI